MKFLPITSDPFLNFIIEVCVCLLTGYLLMKFISEHIRPKTKNNVLLISIFLPFTLFIINILIPILLNLNLFPVIGGIGWTIVGIILYQGLLKDIGKERKIKIENVYENGQIKEEGYELNGIKIGFWEYYNEVYETIKQETYDDKGVLIKEKYFGDGSLESNLDIDNQINGEENIENQTEIEEIENEDEDEDEDEEINNEEEIEEQLPSKRHNKMSRIEKWISTLTKEQKIIIALAFPAMLFSIAYPLTQQIQHHYYRDESLIYNWGIWFIFIAIVAFVEFKIWGQKKEE